jgi:hypothetical protein
MDDTKSKRSIEQEETAKVEHSQATAIHENLKASGYAERFESQDEEWRQQFEKKLLRKVDIRMLPTLIIMYLLNFLDRSNLAQARQGTLEEDLGMTGTDFNLATSIFFVGYLLMQLPSNLLLTKVRPSIYLAMSCCLWGVVSTCNAGAKKFTHLIVIRFFLGFVEAPFFPGAIFLMSSWYTRAELTRRISWFYSGNALANMFGGLLGAAILGDLEGKLGIAGWRWLFIIVCPPHPSTWTLSSGIFSNTLNLGRSHCHRIRLLRHVHPPQLPAHDPLAQRRGEGLCRMEVDPGYQRGRRVQG